jgi:hypothetical protein
MPSNQPWYLRERAGAIDEGSQQIRLVVRSHPLQHGAQPFEAHPRVHGRSWQGTSLLAADLLELHEDQVPNLDPPIAVTGWPLARPPGGHLGAGDVVALVVVDLAARPAGAGVTHGPEIVLVAESDDAIVTDARNLLPQLARLAVRMVNGINQPRRVYRVVLGQQFERERHGVGLEIVPEREIPEHFEERVVPRRPTHVLQIVVLSAGPDALLGGGGACRGATGLAGEYVLELHHAGVREQKRRIVGGYQRRTRDLLVSAGGEEIKELATNGF